MSLLRLQGLAKRYGAVRALDGVSLTVAAGGRTAVVGASGSGKTTLLRVIAGFEVPDSGRVTLGDRLLANGLDAVPTHRRGIGIVSQDGALFPHLTIADNVGFGLPRGDQGRQARIAELMAMVGLGEEMLFRRPDQLSGGQQQRVALARALAMKPRLMLLDEPFSALDTALRAQTRKGVGDLLRAEGITTVLVTHDQAEALSFADQVAVMRDGRLEQVGSPRALYLHPNSPAIARFLGEAVILPALAGDGFAACALGRIPVDAFPPAGPCEIMLRCEQIVLHRRETVPAGGTGDTRDGGVAATVVDAEFGGAVSSVTLSLGSPASLPDDGVAFAVGPAAGPLVVRGAAGSERLAAGDEVTVGVSGLAHVFPGLPA